MREELSLFAKLIAPPWNRSSKVRFQKVAQIRHPQSEVSQRTLNECEDGLQRVRPEAEGTEFGLREGTITKRFIGGDLFGGPKRARFIGGNKPRVNPWS